MKTKEILAANLSTAHHIAALSRGRKEFSIRCFPEVFDTTQRAINVGFVEGDVLPADEHGMIGGTFTVTDMGAEALAILQNGDPTISRKK